MNIYREGWWIFRGEISTWRARDDRVVSGKNSSLLRGFSTSASLRGHPQPPLPPSPFSKGDYFLLICITPRPTKGARDRPCHCNVNKLRLPDLLPRGGHASSFVIAPPLSLYCNAETSTGRQTFFTNPRVSPYSLSPPSPSMTIIVAKWYIPSSTAIYFHVAILRGVIK